MPRNVKEIFNRKCGTEGRALGRDLLLQAKAKHAGSVVSGEGSPRALAEQQAKAITMRQGGVLPQRRVETFVSNLESFVVHNPQVDALYRTTWGSDTPEAARSISEPLLPGCDQSGCKRLVQTKLQYIPK